MKTATVRDLRLAFPRLEALLAEGESISITKHRRVVAILNPPPPTAAGPDFRRRFGGLVAPPRPAGDRERSAVTLLVEERGE